jgi:phosphatidylserine decarboxylase
MFTKYGAREVKISIAVLCFSVGAIGFSALFQKSPYGLVPAAFIVPLCFVALRFFRDPERMPPDGEEKMVSPADGKIVEICESEHSPVGKSKKIAVFMSVFNVHVNRSPLSGEVLKVEHREGEFLNAGRADASHRNEAVDLILRTRFGEIAVRQVAGVIARKIICAVHIGEQLQRGARYGMIKYGSRLEVYVPSEVRFKVTVEVGQRVKAGETVIGVFEV